MGFDSREATPGFKRQIVILNAETRSFKRASIVMKEVVGLCVSTNTIERISLEAGEELATAKKDDWSEVLTGEVVVPPVAIVLNDGGRIRTRQMGCGPGVHLENEGWSETKNAAFISATSETSDVDPEPQPPSCFLNAQHVAKLTEQAETAENTDRKAHSTVDDSAETSEPEPSKVKQPHKPRRILRTVVSSMQNSREFGGQMACEAKRRRFDEAACKAYLGDGLTCNWTIHAEHFSDYVPILDFTHAVTYLFTASVTCFGKTPAAWSAYCEWMTLCWQGNIAKVLDELRIHQIRIGLPCEDTSKDDPREQLRVVIGYLQNNQGRMHYQCYRCQGLPVTTAWMESLVKEVNYRVKGTEMFWNNPSGAVAILQIRAAALSEDQRLTRFLSHRPGRATVRRTPQSLNTAA
jgi:hypothetical protein